MDFNGQEVLPAIRTMKDFERALKSHCKYIVILEIHISQVESVVKHAHQNGKKIFLHGDLIQGLKNDKYSAEFLCQKIKPDGLMSTRGAVLKTAKDNGLIAIQRLFLLDSIALETSLSLAKKIKPTLIEVLPGIAPQFIQKVYQETQIPIIAGGLIKTKEEVDTILEAGAMAITTSKKELWNEG